MRVGRRQVVSRKPVVARRHTTTLLDPKADMASAVVQVTQSQRPCVDAWLEGTARLSLRQTRASTYRIWSSRRRAASQLRWPARSLGSTQRRLYDQAMERRNSRDIGPPSPLIEGHDRW